MSPSQAEPPMSQPFENPGASSCQTCPALMMGMGVDVQKQAWPFAPVRLRGSFPAADALGCAHQFGLSKGIGHGTAPDHGATSPSMALRLGGMVTAPWPAAPAMSAESTAARISAFYGRSFSPDQPGS